MADSTTNAVLSVYTTVGSNLPNLAVENGHLVFVRDKRKIVLDYDGQRISYDQIIELATEGARTSMLAPVTGSYYFVVETGVLWTYRSGWVQITTTPSAVTTAITEALTQAKESGEFDGADGHTPERGVDYWTDEDKAEIKSYVDEAILGGAW